MMHEAGRSGPARRGRQQQQHPPSSSPTGGDDRHPASPTECSSQTTMIDQSSSFGACHKIPDLLDDVASVAPSMASTTCTMSVTSVANSAISVESLRRQRSGLMIDATFDADSDSDSDADSRDGMENVDLGASSSGEQKSRSREWRNNSLLAATKSAIQSSNSLADDGSVGGANRVLLRASTMDVLAENSQGMQSMCHFPDEVDFTKQYLSVLFCGLGELMDCGNGKHAD